MPATVTTAQLTQPLENVAEVAEHYPDTLSSIDGSWIEREQAMRATAKHQGFQKVGSAFREEIKSAINGAIRRGYWSTPE